MTAVIPTVAPSIASVVDRALAFDRDARWQSAGEMRAALVNACVATFGAFAPRKHLSDLAQSASRAGGTPSSEDRGVESRRPAETTSPPAMTPASLLAFEEEASGVPKKTPIGRIVAVLGGVTVAVGALLALRSTLGRQSVSRAQANLVRCLIGEPLGTADASAKYHAIQLGSAGLPKVNGGEGPWPMRCSGRASELARALDDHANAPALAESARALAVSLQDVSTLSPSNDLSPLLDSFFRESASAKMDGRGPSNDVTPPPAPLYGSLNVLKPTFAKPLSIQKMSRSPFVHSTLDFLLQDAALEAPWICHWPGSRLACRKIPAPASAMSPSLQLWGTNAEGVPPFVFAGARGQAGVFRSDTGERVVESVPFDGVYGAFASKAGTLQYLQWQDASPHMLLRRIAPGELVTEHAALDKEAIRFPYFSTALAWEWLVFKVEGENVERTEQEILEGKPRVKVRAITATGALGPLESVGFLAEGGMVEKDDHGAPHISACRSARSTVLRFKGYNRQFMAFRADGRWTQPVYLLSGIPLCGSILGW